MGLKLWVILLTSCVVFILLWKYTGLVLYNKLLFLFAWLNRVIILSLVISLGINQDDQYM